MQKRNAYGVLVRIPEGKTLPVKRRSILEDNTKLDLKKYDTMVWTVFIWFRIGHVAVYREHAKMTFWFHK